MKGPQDSGRRARVLALVILLAMVVTDVLVAVVSGFALGVTVAVSFITAPVAVTPLFAVLAEVDATTMIVGAVLGGEMAAALYAAGQYSRFAGWLSAVEAVALLLAPRTLAMLRLARVPAIPAGPKIPGPTGVLLIIFLTPIAFIAGFLDAMARYPLPAVVAAVVSGAANALVSDSTWWSVPLAAAVVLLPAAARRTGTWILRELRRER